jgi:hypothetical protein
MSTTKIYASVGAQQLVHAITTGNDARWLAIN